MIKDVCFLGLLIAFVVALTAGPSMAEASQQYSEGVWNNFNFTRPATDWSDAAKEFAAEGSLIDLVVAQENLDQFTYIPFPHPDSGYLRSSSQIDRIEPYLQKFDETDQKVILSLQPGRVDPLQLMQILLSRYGHHRCIIGINVDLEWKKTGEANHASNKERDAWLYAIKQHDPDLKLFLTYFRDHTHFPDDADDLVILFDGEGATQMELLKQYKELSGHFKSVGIYTGYRSSHPQTAPVGQIMAAAPNTQYIIHTQDVFPQEKVLIFLISDIQVDWLEKESIDLLDAYKEKNIPTVVGVISKNLDNPNVGGGFLPGMLQELHQNDSDLFEIAEYAYSDQDRQSYEDQKRSINDSLQALLRLGIWPTTLIPSRLNADEDTVRAAEELGFGNMISSSQSLDPGRLKVLNTLVSMTEETGRLKDPAELMAEIDGKEQEAIVVIYQIQNLQPGSGNRIEDLSKILDALKESKRYRFMTADQYLASLPAHGRNSLSMEKLPGWSFYLAAAAMYAISRLFSPGKMGKLD